MTRRLSQLVEPVDLAPLAEQLSALSHDDSALTTLKEYTKNLSGKVRQATFNAPGALIQPPILWEQAQAQQLCLGDEDAFRLLQGDIIMTESAYLLGARFTGSRKFVVANSTCDLVGGRRKHAALFQLNPTKTPDTTNLEETNKINSLLGELLSFKSTQRLYMPILPGDPEGTLFNVLNFDGIVQIRLKDLLLATRVASLSLVGWRIFASMVRTVMCRTGDSEVTMRTHYKSCAL